MIDTQRLRARWRNTELAPLAERLPQIVAAGLSAQRYGDLPRWSAQLSALPRLRTTAVHLNRDRVTIEGDPSSDALTTLEAALQGLHPWRKGPFEVFGLHVDTEWRSDWKWRRLAPHITSLAGRRVLDVGCGNGYHCWRMRGAGAREVIGIDPSPLFILQFQAMQHYIGDAAVNLLPMGIEQLPDRMQAFDSVFSMGVLYHRRAPLEHLRTLHQALRPGGQLVLETLVVAGDERHCLVPEGRYAAMRNVWFLPSAAQLLLWLRKLGWAAPRLIDETPTTTSEQRRTNWMRFHSLSDFLDPGDPSRTVEGYPAPRRALVLAEAPG